MLSTYVIPQYTSRCCLRDCSLFMAGRGPEILRGPLLWQIADGGHIFLGSCRWGLLFWHNIFSKTRENPLLRISGKNKTKKRVGPLFLAGRGALIFGREGKPKSPHPAINNEQPAPNGILCPCINGKHFGNAMGRFIIYGMGGGILRESLYNSRESPY